MTEEQVAPRKKEPLKGFARLKQDLKGMTFKQKADHLWTYYRWIIIVVIMTVIVLSILTTSFINANTNTLLAGVCLNVEPDEQAQKILTDGFQEKNGTGVRWEETKFVPAILTRTTTENIMDNQYNLTNIHALIISEDLDYLISDEEGIIVLLPENEQDQILLDLNQFFTPEEMERFGQEQRLILTEGPNGEEMPVGVDISDLPLIKKHFKADEKVYFCLTLNMARKEKLHAFWEYINAWEG